MILTKETAVKIQKIQQENNIQNNVLYVVALTIALRKKSFFHTLLEELKISYDELLKYVELLTPVLSQDDVKFIQKSATKKHSIVKSYNDEIEKIIQHLNQLTNSRRRNTPSRAALITKWLKQGYSLEDFLLVNEYFFYSWKDNPDLSDYIRPETLYNNKFPERVETAREEHTKIQKYQTSIVNIFHKYRDAYMNYCDPDYSVTEIPFNIQKLIIFWLQKYSEEDIILTIEVTIQEWSKNSKYKSYISLEKILDSKFPTRYEVVKRKIQKNKSIDSWLYKK